ncbi:DEAD/DEAH box helicase [Bartonella sp. TP]|uniref:DEAD/DEAH box helicase n=1 Tax=Bartonella sp. TP TaxID=3057550 RepID=UPI0025B1DF22|nr:DEAD/DEAH box helicase [Bartonella sp. TP]MDN5249455.1 DEAD/DEAH box helicase [Alphaproteobacteria bacterium]WJW79796.1 DEAD/DEAH box helicase [Bartonella sp. TP]
MTPRVSDFASFGLSQVLLNNLYAIGVKEPKPIQALAIPQLLQEQDLLAVAQTGSGKTFGFCLPLINKILQKGAKRAPKTAECIILVPTRELAVQIEHAVRTVVRSTHLSVALVLGGVAKGPQIKKVAPGVDVLIATPGRLMDLMRDKAITLQATKYLVLDEADRMLDMGFIQPIKNISAAVHPQCQKALFSATMPDSIKQLANNLLKRPVYIAAEPQGTVGKQIKQLFYKVPASHKKTLLHKLLTEQAFASTIIFTKTKHSADNLEKFLAGKDLAAAVIHGNKSQNARQHALRSFRKQEVAILVATDLVARGIDVPHVSHVINYDLPTEGENYVHRIGRTGRNEATGTSITLYSEAHEYSLLKAIEKATSKKIVDFITVDLPGVDTSASESKRGPLRPSFKKPSRDQRSDRARKPYRPKTARAS